MGMYNGGMAWQQKLNATQACLSDIPNERLIMATYVFSDVHGHCKTLTRLLEQVSPSDEDDIFMLGDMIDRGPDPIGVIETCFELAQKGATVLSGNHEDLMLTFLRYPQDSMNVFNWEINGGGTTAAGLRNLPDERSEELVSWIENLPLYAYAAVGEGDARRQFIFVHAGLNTTSLWLKRDTWPEPATWGDEDIERMLEGQDPEDLMWIRDEFWGQPTRLVNGEGKGPIVVAGHTPTTYLNGMADLLDRSPVNEEGLCRIVKVGASEQTGGQFDRVDIDCGAAGGAGFGQVGMLRLDDFEEFYEPVREGE